MGVPARRYARGLETSLSAERAVEILGVGYLAHPANASLRERFSEGRLSTNDFVDQLRTVVYRLVVATLIEIPPANGIGNSTLIPWLDTARDLDSSELDPGDIERVLAELAIDRSKVDELGRIHQRLTGFEAEMDVERGVFQRAPGSPRRAHGVYYTPDVLVESLLDHSLEPLIEQTIARKAPDDAEQALLALRILDPAVGSGRFLVAAARRLTRRVAQLRSARRMPTLTAARDVVQRCLYGVDIDPISVNLARLALWMEAGRPGNVDANWPANLRVGNALCGATQELVRGGIPDTAYEPAAGDDPKVTAELRKTNRTQRSDSEIVTLEPVAWDAWCAAHTMSKDGMRAVPTSAHLSALEDGELQAAINAEREAHRFFHWPLEFPEVKFDLVVANPPFANGIERDMADRTSRIAMARTPGVAGVADIAFRFLAAATEWVKPGGWIAMIQPRAALNAKALEGFRANLPNGLHPRLLCAIDRSDLFQGADVYVSLVVLGPPGTCTIPDPSDPGHDRWVWVDRVPSNWYVAARGKSEPETPTSDHQALGEVFEVSASMTAAEAYAVKPYVSDGQRGRGQKLITTGLIDPDKIFWGLEDCRYLGARFRYPRITPSEAMPASLQRRLLASKRPKVLVGGLGSRVEAFFDAQGQCQGAVSTYSIFHPHDDIEALRRVMEFLNRPEISERMRLELGANALGGGSITIKKQWLKELPFPNA